MAFYKTPYQSSSKQPGSSQTGADCRRAQFDSWIGKICWRRDRLPTPVFLGFPCGSAGKNPPAMWETWVQSLGWEDPLEKGTGYPLQYSALEHSTDCIVHRVAKNRTRLSDFHFTSHIYGIKRPESLCHLFPKYLLHAYIHSIHSFNNQGRSLTLC